MKTKPISIICTLVLLLSGILVSNGQEKVDFTSPAFSPNGKFLLFAANLNEQYDLYVMNLDSKEVHQLTNNPANDWYGEWINDNLIYFQSERDDKKCLYSLDFETNKVELLIDDNVNQVLHYNGQNNDIYYITFETKLAPNNKYYPKMETSEIMKYNIKTKLKSQITKNDYTDDAPHTVDGKLLVFQSGKNGDIDIYKMNLSDLILTQLTDYKGFDGIPVFSPDGKHIAFSRKVDNKNYEVWVMDEDGKNQKNLSNNEAMDLYAAWTPDGKKIAFSSWRDGNQNIYLMDSDTGENQKCITCNIKF